jgi:pilus assembly protein CpaB
MKRTIIGVVVAVTLAAVGTLFLLGFVRGAEDRALAGQETSEVLVVTTSVVKGTAAADLSTSVSTERVPAKVRAKGSVADLEDLKGQVTAVDLVPGEQLVAARFLTPAQLEEASEVEVPEGLQEVTISLEPQRAVGGQIASGDTVGLFASFAPDVSPYNSKLILHKLLVTNVQVEQLPVEPVEGETEKASGPDLAPTGNLLVTLAVDVAQAERTVFSAEHGTIWLSAEPEAAKEDGSQLRDPEGIYGG